MNLSVTNVKDNTMNLSERSEDKELLSVTNVKDNTMNLSEHSYDNTMVLLNILYLCNTK